MTKIAISKESLLLSDEIIGFFMKRVTPFGTGAKVDCPKEYLGKTVYLVICKNECRRTTTRRNKKTAKGKRRIKEKV